MTSNGKARYFTDQKSTDLLLPDDVLSTPGLMRRPGHVRYHRPVTATSHRIPTWAIDALLALTLTAGALVDLGQINDTTLNALGFRDPNGFTFLVILLQTVPVAFRRRFPTTALLVASLGFFLDRNLNYPDTIAIFGLLFLFHAVGSELPRRRAHITGWTTIGLMTAFTISGVLADVVSIGTPLVVLVFTSFPFILGLESRERRAAGEAERAGHEGLVELRRLLGMLRTDEPVSRTPQPGLQQLDALIDQMTEAGLNVTVRQEGEPRPIPPAWISTHTGSSRSRSPTS